MTSKHLIIGVSLVTAALTGSAWSQQDEKLGKVSFPTSCDPKVQADFERGVAMLHSYWFLYACRTFEGVLQQDPNCAMAYWGVAMDLLGNTLAQPPSRRVAKSSRGPAGRTCGGRSEFGTLADLHDHEFARRRGGLGAARPGFRGRQEGVER
jgi:hypothetical protein